MLNNVCQVNPGFFCRKKVAFPLISAGIYGFPEKDAFFVAKRTIDEFLKDNEMEVYLSTFVKDILSLIMGLEKGI